jgi:hypothetical protein
LAADITVSLGMASAAADSLQMIVPIDGSGDLSKDERRLCRVVG